MDDDRGWGEVMGEGKQMRARSEPDPFVFVSPPNLHYAPTRICIMDNLMGLKEKKRARCHFPFCASMCSLRSANLGHSFEMGGEASEVRSQS